MAVDHAQIAAQSLDAHISNIMDKGVQALGAGLDHIINERLIGGLGNMLDAATKKCHEMECSPSIVDGVKGALPQMASKAESSPDHAPAVSPKGPELERSRSPELGKAASIALSSGVSSQSIGCISGGHDCSMELSGTFSPASTPSVGQMHSQGRGI